MKRTWFLTPNTIGLLAILVLVRLGVPFEGAGETRAEAAEATETNRETPVIDHRLAVHVSPATHALSVTDTLTLPESLRSSKGKQTLYFFLHAGLEVRSLTKGVRLKALPSAPDDDVLSPSFSRFDASDWPVPLQWYRLRLPGGMKRFVLSYQGELHHPVEQGSEEYARGFSETPGFIGDEGVFLAGSSAWYPMVGDGLQTFALDVELPLGWDGVSQGRREAHEKSAARTRTRWVESHPQTEIYLVAGRFTEYTRAHEGPVAMVFLRTPDTALASRYLDATLRYLDKYSQLIGPYPYEKFALVENFWETGYGMPSFTLLGSRIIRFPFILTSSYPHEILHNWWGNGVYVDYDHGNWCEGLTAYLSDYLFKEEAGQGAAYRRRTLRKYTDYAAGGHDFPLRAFTERHSASTEAVGYGKSLMLWHMIRRAIGDDAFFDGLRRFYKDKRFQRAGFEDLERAFERAGGRSLDTLFHQWVDRKGAPRLSVHDVRVEREGEGYRVNAIVEEIQPDAPFLIDVPIALTLEGKREALLTTLRMENKEARFSLRVRERPLRMDVDPGFDVFRVLDRRELPPSLSGLYGADRVTIVLPSAASADMRDAYRAMAERWRRGREAAVDIIEDSELDAFPSDRALWLFGWDNRLLRDFRSTLEGLPVAFEQDGLRLEDTTLPREDHAFVLTSRNPGNSELDMAWVGAARPASLSGLTRKLPHYHAYSFLAFEGDEPRNIMKGQWPIVSSPMTFFFVADDEERPPMGTLEEDGQ